MEHIAPAGNIYQAGTLSGNPLAMAAGFETLNALTKEDYEHMNQKIDRLVAGYQKAAEDNDIALQVTRAGSRIGVLSTYQDVISFETAKSSDTERIAACYRGMIEACVFLPPSQCHARC